MPRPSPTLQVRSCLSQSPPSQVGKIGTMCSAPISWMNNHGVYDHTSMESSAQRHEPITLGLNLPCVAATISFLIDSHLSLLRTSSSGLGLETVSITIESSKEQHSPAVFPSDWNDLSIPSRFRIRDLRCPQLLCPLPSFRYSGESGTQTWGKLWQVLNEHCRPRTPQVKLLQQN